MCTDKKKLLNKQQLQALHFMTYCVFLVIDKSLAGQTSFSSLLSLTLNLTIEQIIIQTPNLNWFVIGYLLA